jgi:methylmalonyl-CoA mutase C-terminal domain/subunit
LSALVRDGPKALIAKTGLDGHWRGVAVVAVALRNAGFEVVTGGMLTADEVATTALQEDIDLIGLNVGGRIEVVFRIAETLRDQGLGDIPLFAGGSISPAASARLAGIGIQSFPAGSSLESIVDAARALTAHRPRT